MGRVKEDLPINFNLLISIWKEREKMIGQRCAVAELNPSVQRHAFFETRLGQGEISRNTVDYASAFLVEWIRAQWFVNRYLVHVTARPLAAGPAPR